MFFGDDIPAAEARELGFVTEVVPSEELDAAVDTLVRRLASAPTKAVGATKLLVNRAMESDRDTAFLEEAYLQEVVQSTGDAREGMMSFVERRSPEFRGW
jgi:2-(1,2-epoxy-1,2-dihydrophenyl)acetyl-CoA isomerase